MGLLLSNGTKTLIVIAIGTGIGLSPLRDSYLVKLLIAVSGG